MALRRLRRLRRPTLSSLDRLPTRSGLLWLLALVLGALLPSAHAQAQPAVQRIEQALRSEAEGPQFPAQAPAQAVALPDDWSRSRPGRSGPAWYRLNVDLPAVPPGELLGLHMAHACSALQVHLNGQLVARTSRLAEPLPPDCQHPQLVALAPALLRPGRNVVDIQVHGHALESVASRRRAAALSAISVGPLETLRAEQRWQHALQVTLPQALGATLLLTGGFMFVLGYLNRRESHLAYFGALSCGWALLDAPLWLHDWPLPTQLLETLLATLLPLLTWAGVQFLLRYARERIHLVDILLPLQAVLMPLSLLVAGPHWLHALTLAWTALFVAELAAAAVHHLRLQWRERSASFWLMGALLAGVAVAGLVELTLQQPASPGLAAQLAQPAVALLLVLVGFRLVHEHGQARQQAEAGRASLELRVREATAEIERNFRQLSELKIEQVTERERKRIAADLHDDLGAKLLTIVHTSDNDRISSLAREALEEMRLSVRGLTGRAVMLSDALGDWRAEVVSRLAQAGIEAEWSAPEDLAQRLSARAYVQTTRILREATSNIIKHSGASACSVRCGVADGDLQLVVQDNGDGIVSEPDGRIDRGHGMATMKSRAKQLQGQCLVETGPGLGTVIRLTIPLDRALESA